jgi:hypothetical protein
MFMLDDIGASGENLSWDTGTSVTSPELCHSHFMHTLSKGLPPGARALVINIYSDKTSLDKL